MPHMAIEPMRVGNLRPYAKNARTHSKKQIKQIARSIERFGFTNPVLISNENEIIAAMAGSRQRSSSASRASRRSGCPTSPRSSGAPM
jgi:hypothetical protein